MALFGALWVYSKGLDFAAFDKPFAQVTFNELAKAIAGWLLVVVVAVQLVRLAFIPADDWEDDGWQSRYQLWAAFGGLCLFGIGFYWMKRP